MAVEITSKEELEAWLEDKPREWAQVIALRSALRVFPLVANRKNSRKTSSLPKVILSTLRALIVSSASIKYPSEDMISSAKLEEAANNAARAADMITVIHGQSLPVDAAARASSAAFFASSRWGLGHALNAARASEFAARAQAFAVQRGVITSWKITSGDCETLQDGKTPEDLLESRFWLDAPDWWSDAWDQARKWLSSSGQGFEIWREWYYGRLEGLPHAFADFDDEADEKFYRWIVEQGDDWWKREPAEVNAEITQFVDGLRKPKAKPPTEAELAQNPRAFTFALDSEGRSDLDEETLPNGLQGDADERDNHSEILRLIDAALQATASDTNAKEIAGPTERLKEAVGASIEELRPRWFVLRARDLIRWVEESKSDDMRIASLSLAQSNAYLPLVAALRMIAEFSPKLAELWHGKLGQTGTPLTREMLDMIAEALRTSGQTTALAQSVIEASNSQVAPDAPEDDPARIAASETSRNAFRKMGGTLKKAGEGAKGAENIISLVERLYKIGKAIGDRLPSGEIIARILGSFGGG